MRSFPKDRAHRLAIKKAFQETVRGQWAGITRVRPSVLPARRIDRSMELEDRRGALRKSYGGHRVTRNRGSYGDTWSLRKRDRQLLSRWRDIQADDSFSPNRPEPRKWKLWNFGGLEKYKITANQDQRDREIDR